VKSEFQSAGGFTRPSLFLCVLLAGDLAICHA